MTSERDPSLDYKRENRIYSLVKEDGIFQKLEELCQCRDPDQCWTPDFSSPLFPLCPNCYCH